MECKRCHPQYIGETKRLLSEGFGEHRRSILNHQHLSTTTLVSLHFNQAGHSINDVRLIPIELIRSKRTLVPEAFFYSFLANFATRTASFSYFLSLRSAERREKKASGRDRWEPHFHAISF